ncbi:hypothetical protein [Pseudomonas syringae]|uniref:hypothetical protein n=1 Tax=Pseudomonas syringae TaxID=317 RepID=UPI0018642058|nr:hypothetical protein [Pseudomonas syringae]
MFYVPGTLFSMSMLSVVSAMLLKLSYKLAAALWVAKGLNSLMDNYVEGLSSQAMQQGGIGLLLTTVIISMTTVAAALWQVSMDSLMAFSAFDSAGSSPRPQGQTPMSYMLQRVVIIHRYYMIQECRLLPPPISGSLGNSSKQHSQQFRVPRASHIRITINSSKFRLRQA